MKVVHHAVRAAALFSAAAMVSGAWAQVPGQIFSFEDSENVTVETPNAGTQTWLGGIASLNDAYTRTEGALTRHDPTAGYIWGQSFESDSAHAGAAGFVNHTRSTIGATDGSYSMHIQDPDGGFAWGTQVLFNDINDPRWTALTTGTKIMYEVSTPGGPTPNGLPDYQVGFGAVNFSAGFLTSYNLADVGNEYQFASGPAAQTEFSTQTYIWDSGGQMISAAGSNWPGLTEYVIFHWNQNSPAGVPADYYLDNFRVINELPNRPRWNTIATGEWTNASNWANGVPNSVGAPAIFYGNGAGIGTATTAATVNVNSAVTVGSIIFDAQMTSYQWMGTNGAVTSPNLLPSIVNYTIAGSGNLTLDVASGLSEIYVVAGNHSINVPVNVNDDLRIDTTAGFGQDANPNLRGGGRWSSAPASSLTFGGPVNVGAGLSMRTSGGGSFAFTGGINAAAATVRFNGGRVTIGGNVNAGTLVISPASRVGIAPNGSTTVRTASLTIGDGVNPSAIDITNNGVILDHTGTPADIRALILSGRAGGAWTGPGINSSAAAANGNRFAVGYAEAGDVFGAGGGTFLGQSVDGTTTLARFTILGDANLSGTADISDFALLAANFNVTNTGWRRGDFNYDGKTDISDFAGLAANFNVSVASLPRTTVPEPALGAMALVGLSMLRRRK